jgi:transposase
VRGRVWNLWAVSIPSGPAIQSAQPGLVSFPAERKSAILAAVTSSCNRWLMKAYLELTDAEWQLIQPILPVPKRGPKRPHGRAACAAFLFCKAAGVSIESLPLGQFPDSGFLRTTWKRWAKDKEGTLARLFEVGAKAQARMEAQFDDHIRRLTLDRVVVTGEATATLPRWTHVRGV